MQTPRNATERRPDIDLGLPRPRMVEPLGIRGSVGICRGCRQPVAALMPDGKCPSCTSMPELPTAPRHPQRGR